MSFDPNRDYKNEFYYRESLRRKIISIIILVGIGLIALPFIIILIYSFFMNLFN